MKDLGTYRKSYDRNELIENQIPSNPIDLFGTWFSEVEQSGGVEEVNAMSISTIGLDGFPKTRVVLLKQFTSVGFIFYTNYNSEKGKAIAINPNICLSFFWPNLERQVIIKGVANKVSTEISDQYFNSRPQGSKLGAIVSEQSNVIANRDFLENKLAELKNSIQNQTIERPDNWGGFIVNPTEIEFWQGRPNRLHDRIRYQKTGIESWKTDRLSP